MEWKKKDLPLLEDKIKRLEQEVKFTEKLLEILPVPVFYEDTQGRYLGCNHAFGDFMGKREDEILARTIFDIVDSNTAETYYHRDQKMIEERIPNLVEERQMLHSDGTYHDIVFYKTLILKEDGDPSGLIGVFFDITARKKAEGREREYLERLQKLTYALSITQEAERKIIAMEIHDSISQNLALSKLRLQMLEESVESPFLKDELNKVVRTLDESLQRTRSQVFDLGLPILYQFGLDHAIRCLKENLLEKYGLNVAFRSTPLPDNLSDNFKAFLFRSIRELLMNVIKHARTKEAELLLTSQSGEILAEVSDRGLGFALDDLDIPHLSGNSCGLFSLRTMISLMGGRMEVLSMPGKGTTIRLIFPQDAFSEKSGYPERGRTQ